MITKFPGLDTSFKALPDGLLSKHASEKAYFNYVKEGPFVFDNFEVEATLGPCTDCELEKSQDGSSYQG